MNDTIQSLCVIIYIHHACILQWRLHCLHKGVFLLLYEIRFFQVIFSTHACCPNSSSKNQLFYSSLNKGWCARLRVRKSEFQYGWSLHSSCMINRFLNLAESRASLSVKLKIVFTSQVRFWGLNEVMSAKFLDTVKHCGCIMGTHLRHSDKVMDNPRVSIKSPWTYLWLWSWTVLDSFPDCLDLATVTSAT